MVGKRFLYFRSKDLEAAQIDDVFAGRGYGKAMELSVLQLSARDDFDACFPPELMIAIRPKIPRNHEQLPDYLREPASAIMVRLR